MILSSFQEVLLLDADNHPAQNPTFLFSQKEYQDTGAIFWPDRIKTGPESPLWELFGVPFRDEPDHETGQIVGSTARCRPADRTAVARQNTATPLALAPAV